MNQANCQKNSKAQVAAEFLLYSAVFMFLVIAAYVVINQVQNVELPARENSVAKETGEGFLNAISLSVKGSYGFTYKYTFPKTILGAPYSIDLTDAQRQKVMRLDWAGPYGNATFAYSLPQYNYVLASSSCTSDNIIHSDRCKNVLTLSNDGESLTFGVSE